MDKITPRLIECFELFGFKNIKELPHLKEVRKQYYRAAKSCHPDKNVTESAETKQEREEYFKKLLNAYNELAQFISENLKVEGDDEEEIMARN